jgi:predicted Fe-Mo cluster-binding NifX family protein
MLIAISTDEDQKSSPVSAIFGRCGFFALFDTEEQSLEFVKNPGAEAARGAGVLAGQLLIDKGVKRVYTGNVGPNAKRVLDSGDIKVELVSGKTVEDVIEGMK